MMDWQVSALSALLPATASPVPARATNDVVADGFVQLFEHGVAQVDLDIRGAEKALGELAAGRTTELHEVMISLEKARISVQTFIQVRNKVLESYQDLMRMQM
jgi:flagellar hook-basal body complex protein FliE